MKEIPQNPLTDLLEIVRISTGPEGTVDRSPAKPARRSSGKGGYRRYQVTVRCKTTSEPWVVITYRGVEHMMPPHTTVLDMLSRLGWPHR